MADISILATPTAPVPTGYTVAGTQEIILKGVTASFDGTSAAGAWVPAVQVIDPGGHIVGTYTASALAAGASADVSWFPIGNGTDSSSGGVRVLPAVIEEGGAIILTGVRGDFFFPFSCVITAWTMQADTSGSMVVDVWKTTYASYPPTVANTITGGNPPTITAAVKAQSTTLTGWSPTISAGDVMRFNVNSNDTITRLTLSLTLST